MYIGAAEAQPVPADLRVKLQVDLPVTLGLGALWIASEAGKSALAPDHARWARENTLDRSVADALRWSHAARADHASNWLGFGALPLGAFGGLFALSWADARRDSFPVDALLLTESVSVAAFLNQGVKFAVGRRRPFAQDAAHRDGADNNLSFYSGHTSLAFSVAVAAASIATLRGYRGAPYLWALGVPLAALTGYLRMAADKHYLSDVALGALMGTAVGLLVPWLHRRPEASRLRVTPMAQAFGVSLTLQSSGNPSD
jgi:membrane-associated phospholipid phosphatase